MTLNAAKSSIPFGCIKRQPKARWSTEVNEAVSERLKAFAAAHRSNEDRQAYITASRHASSVIAKGVLSLSFCCCSSSSSPNFPNCFFPRDLALVFVDYLRSHFSVSRSKALCSRGYLSEFRRATLPKEFHLSFCLPSAPAEFHADASNLSSLTATGPDKVAYPMLKHLPRSGMDFLRHIFNLSWTLHSFHSI